MTDSNRPNADAEDFVRLLTANERRIFTYLLALLSNVADAEDVMQETSIILWRKFADYQTGSDFTAWAYRIAQNVARNHRAKQHRCRVKFDDALFTAVAADVESMREELDSGRTLLLDCIEELPPGDRDLIERRYEVGATVKSIAAAVGRPIEGLYKAMRRIHDALYDCVERKLNSEGIHVRKS